MNPNILSLIELALNVTLTAIPLTAAFAPLAQALEASINPLLLSIKSGQTKTQDVLTVYGTLIGIIEVLKQQTNLAPEVLAKLDEYGTAAREGTKAAILAGQQGFDPSQLTPVQPIA